MVLFNSEDPLGWESLEFVVFSAMRNPAGSATVRTEENEENEDQITYPTGGQRCVCKEFDKIRINGGKMNG